MQASNNKRTKIIIAVFLAIFILFILFGSGKNTIDLIFALSTFAVISFLFLIKQPIIFFTLSYHALQSTIKVFSAEINGELLNNLTNYSPTANLSEALRLSCIGLIAISIAINLFLPKKIKHKDIKFNIHKLIFLYIILLIVQQGANSIGQLGGLFQLLYKISTLKWGVLFLIIYDGWKNRNYYFLIIIILEIVVSLFSYFASFRNVLFVAFMALLILNFHYFKIKTKYFLIAGTITFSFMLVWQSIKGEYRSFLSQDEKTQSVNVEANQAYDKLLDLVAEQPIEISSTLDNTVDRLSYIDFFAESIHFVPVEKSHTNGEIWLDNINHIIQPRLFFPNKKAIDDSQRTMDYTGLLLAGAEQGTSISLGYIAESYVDFGTVFFIIPLFLLGLLIGWFFKKLFNSGIHTLYCWALSIPFYFNFYGLEMAGDKLLGAMVMYFLVTFLIIFYFKNRLNWLER